jgi:MOSC domain-containing protein YiiM
MPAADEGFRGLTGDVQRVRVHHGRPWQALCIYADEVIEMLRAEGHPIGRGSVGENITVRGLPWEHVRPGVILRLGTVLAHVQAFAEPCATNKAFFIDGEFHRMNANRGPVSRVYATVLGPGRIAEGDAVVLEPTGATVASPGRG